MEEGLPVERLVRGSDPETSLEAARKAAKASAKAIAAVRGVMQDRVPRIDEEIWWACRDAGYISSLATVQHGRLALSEANHLIPTGITRLTTNNAPSLEWRWGSGTEASMTENNGTNGTERPRIAPFETLRANVKGVIVDRLGPMTAWVGENRTGKTSRIDAIRLALTGKHPAGPHGSDLMELAPDGAPLLFAELEGPSGQAKFVLETEGGKPKKPGKPEATGLLKTVVESENILPMQSMRQLIDLGSTLGREAIFRRFGQISSVPVPRGLSETQTKLWDDGLRAVKGANTKADSAELLSRLAAWMRQKKLGLGTDIKALDKLIEEREQVVKATAAGEEQIPALRQKLRDAEAWERAETIRNRRAQIEQEAATYRTKVGAFNDSEKEKDAEEGRYQTEDTNWKARVEGLWAEVTQLQVQSEDEKKRLHGGEFIKSCVEQGLKQLEAGHEPNCILCGKEDWDVKATQAAIEPKIQARLASWEHVQDELAKKQAEVQEAERDHRVWMTGIEAKRRVRENEKNLLKQEYLRIKTAQEENTRALEGTPAAYDGVSSGELRIQLKKLEDAASLSRQLEQDVVKLKSLHVDQGIAKTLEQEATKELSALLVRTAEAAHSAVNTYMPEGFRAEIDLESAKWRVIGADGRPHRRDIMAGSERGALVAALALGWTEGAPARYVVLDDEDLAPFSPAVIRRLFDTLKDALDDGLLTQVFVTSSRPAEVPDYVTKIVTEGTQAALTTPAALPQVQPSYEPPAFEERPATSDLGGLLL